MIGGARDLPLARDEASRYLPWAVALLVLLGTLALASAMILAGARDTWRSNVTGTLTVQIPRADARPVPADPDAGGETGRAANGSASARTDDRIAPARAEQRRRADAALAILRETDGVRSADIIPESQMATLLEPWLGRQAMEADLPMPVLIDVAVTAPGAVDTAALSRRLVDAAPGAVVDDHAVWLHRLSDFASMAENVVLLLLAIIMVSAVMTVVFTTRTGLAIHRDVIEVLHLIGARDAYIARQFQLHAFRLAAVGAVAGFVLAAAAIALLGLYGGRIDNGLVPDLALGTAQWIVLIGVPAAAVALVVATAGMTVTRSLGRMM